MKGREEIGKQNCKQERRKGRKKRENNKRGGIFREDNYTRERKLIYVNETEGEWEEKQWEENRRYHKREKRMEDGKKRNGNKIANKDEQ